MSKQLNITLGSKLNKREIVVGNENMNGTERNGMEREKSIFILREIKSVVVST